MKKIITPLLLIALICITVALQGCAKSKDMSVARNIVKDDVRTMWDK